jgi:hypothetical protein
MDGITNKYLESLSKKILLNFIGVFPCDIQPEINGINCFSLIFNESKHDEEGTHFIAIYANKNYVYYFDSLGLKLENDFIKMFLYSCGRKVRSENIQIQSFDSSFCGFFCLFFLMYMEQDNAKFKKFYSFFNHSNLSMNNAIVTDLITMLIKKNKSRHK